MRRTEMTFDQLSKYGWGYYAEPENIDSLKDFESQLMQLLSSGAYYFGGKIIEAREQVDRLNGIKIEIYSNEHPPPHFHIIANGLKASLRIDNGEILENSGFTGKQIRTVQIWFLKSKDKLIEVWNKTRPNDCQVGYYRG